MYLHSALDKKNGKKADFGIRVLWKKVPKSNDQPLYMANKTLFSKAGVMAWIVNVPQRSLYLLPTLQHCVQMVEHLLGGEGLLETASMGAFAGDYGAPTLFSSLCLPPADALTVGTHYHRLKPLKSRYTFLILSESCYSNRKLIKLVKLIGCISIGSHNQVPESLVRKKGYFFLIEKKLNIFCSHFSPPPIPPRSPPFSYLPNCMFFFLS